MKFSSDDADGLIAIVRQAARREIMPRYRRLSAGAIRTKSSESDLVTDADRGAEAFIQRGILDLMPGATVVGEEAVADDEGLLDRIGTSDLAVIVDPVDGTWNFAKGLPLFGVIVAVVAGGETVFGLLYDPVMDDWVAAIKNQGAFFGRPDETPQPVRVSPPAPRAPLDRLSGFVPLGIFPRQAQFQLAPMLADFERVTSLRCSCHEYRMLAEGQVAFGLTGSLKPWDHAAGALIHSEAGGYAALMDGTPYRPTLTAGNLLLAPNVEVWGALRDRFAFLAEFDPTPSPTRTRIRGLRSEKS